MNRPFIPMLAACGLLLGLAACDVIFPTEPSERFCSSECPAKWEPHCLSECDIEAPAGCPDRCQDLDTWEDECLDMCAFSDAGMAGQGGDSGQGGMGGQGGSMGGSGGEDGGTPACGEECAGDTPYCDEEAAQCVACLNDDHCDDGVCNPNAQQCVACLEDDHCNGEAPHCDRDTNTCVPCLQDTNCSDPTASRCDTSGEAPTCAACTEDNDCQGITDGDTVLALCEAGECVECTKHDFSACGENEADMPFVCNAQTQRCSDQPQGSKGLCAACVSDAACEPGKRCVRERFDGQALDYVCLWEVGADAGGAPTTCGDARPYVGFEDNVTSIDGAEVDVCTLAVTTCQALAEFRNTPCDDANDDDACGLDGTNDGLCRQESPGTFSCTVPCSSSKDCRLDHACNVTASPPYCDLQTDTCYSDQDCPEGQTCTGNNQCMQQ